MGMMINRRRAYGGKKGLPYGAVDMGLPSGTLWAQGNIVKDANGNYAIGEPSDYGSYFSWGNIDGHNAGDGYRFMANYELTPGSQLTGNIPSDDALHDAAVANIGEGWHMPTKGSFEELFNNSYTTIQWTSVNDVNGYLLTSITNGNTIFFPTTGYRDGVNVAEGNNGFYWSNSYYNRDRAYRLQFGSTYILATTYLNFYRANGFMIRPIYTPNN